MPSLACCYQHHPAFLTGNVHLHRCTAAELFSELRAHAKLRSAFAPAAPAAPVGSTAAFLTAQNPPKIARKIHKSPWFGKCISCGDKRLICLCIASHSVISNFQRAKIRAVKIKYPKDPKSKATIGAALAAFEGDNTASATDQPSEDADIGD